MEQELRAGGVLCDDGVGPAPQVVSGEEAIAFLDDFVARLDARMAAAAKPLPVAENLQAVISEVSTNVDAAAAAAANAAEDSSDDEEEEDETEEEEEAGEGEGAATAADS